MSRILAVDLGGSTLKAGVLSFEGGVEASVTFPVGFEEDGTGRSEQHPDRWWRGFTDAVEALAARSGLRGLVAVVACGATRTQVFLDARGRAVRPAIGYRDTRAGRAAEQALQRPRVADHPEAKHLDRFHPLARLLWLREADPDGWAATRTVLDPKDWLVFRLTGHAVSDPISQERLASAALSRRSGACRCSAALTTRGARWQGSARWPAGMPTASPARPRPPASSRRDRPGPTAC